MKLALPFGVTYLFYANVYGWRMTGLLGPGGSWFLGLSTRGI
jgi:hypothetical protein